MNEQKRENYTLKPLKLLGSAVRCNIIFKSTIKHGSVIICIHLRVDIVSAFLSLREITVTISVYLLTDIRSVSMNAQMVMLEYVTSKTLTRETCEIMKVCLLSSEYF